MVPDEPEHQESRDAPACAGARGTDGREHGHGRDGGRTRTACPPAPQRPCPEADGNRARLLRPDEHKDQKDRPRRSALRRTRSPQMIVDTSAVLAILKN